MWVLALHHVSGMDDSLRALRVAGNPLGLKRFLGLDDLVARPVRQTVVLVGGQDDSRHVRLLSDVRYVDSSSLYVVDVFAVIG